MSETPMVSEPAERDVGTVGLPRAGELWTREETEQLLEGVRADLPVEVIAARLGRSPGAVRSRVRLLVPEQAGPFHNPACRIEWLRDRLREGSYDWSAVFTEHTRDTEMYLWTPGQDALLRQAWATGTPTLTALSQQLQASEVIIVNRLIKLGLAGTLVEATDRLGCAEDGTVAFRRALTLDHAQYTLHVLVVLDDAGLRHVSVHRDPDQARTIGDQVVTALHGKGATGAHWQIAARLPEVVAARQQFTVQPDPPPGPGATAMSEAAAAQSCRPDQPPRADEPTHPPRRALERLRRRLPRWTS